MTEKQIVPENGEPMDEVGIKNTIEYTKNILEVMPPIDEEAEKRISDLIAKKKRVRKVWANEKPNKYGEYKVILSNGIICKMNFCESTKVICNDGIKHNSHEIRYWFENK